MKNKSNKTALLLVPLLATLSSMQLFAMSSHLQSYSNIATLEDNVVSSTDNDSVKIAITMTEDELKNLKDNDVLSLAINMKLSIQLSVPDYSGQSGTSIMIIPPKIEDNKIIKVSMNYDTQNLWLICTPLSIGQTKMTIIYPNCAEQEVMVKVTEAIPTDVE